MDQKTLSSFLKRFLHTYEKGNLEALSPFFASDLKSYITNKTGGTDLVEGRNAYLERIQALNLSMVNPTLTLIQLHQINPQEALIMVEIKAKKGSESLQNYAAFLLRFQEDQIIEMRMVEAQPEHSDFFWAQ